jgi:COMPASS component SPP1
MILIRLVYRACDNCEEWYHGDCINITASEAKSIKRYFCPPCVGKNSDLEIEYKKVKPSSKRDAKKSESKVGRPPKSSKETPVKPGKVI